MLSALAGIAVKIREISLSDIDTCYSESDSNSDVPPAATSLSNTEIFGSSPLGVDQQRVVLAGDFSGTQPITGNTQPSVFINGIEQINLIKNDGRVIVDVPFGSELDIIFEPEPNTIGTAGSIYCFYPDAEPELVFLVAQQIHQVKQFTFVLWTLIVMALQL